MFNYCKICGSCLLLDRRIWDSSLPDAYWYKCKLCPEYNLLLASDKITVESEGIRVANFKLIHFPSKKKSSLWQDKEVGQYLGSEKLMTFDMEELTPEEAVRWLKKLKTYVLLQ